MQESEDRTCSLRGQGRQRREEGGQSEKSEAAGLHCTQGVFQISPQENRTGEDLGPARVALQVNADSKRTHSLTGNCHSEAGPHNQRPPRSMKEFQVRISSFRRMPLTESKVCKRRRTQVLLAGDASEKFVPRGFQGSREFAKCAGSRVTHAPKERVGAGVFAKHLLDDFVRVTQTDNLARATRLVHSSMPEVSTEIEVSKKGRLNQGVGIIALTVQEESWRLQERSLVRRVTST